MNCYACNKEPGEPRDIGGTTYHICKRCYKVHIKMNALAVSSLKDKGGLHNVPD